MSMYETKKADALDGRMEKILRLKEFEKNNHIHMNSISDIMGYERSRDSVYDTDGQINTDISKNQTKEGFLCLKFRLIFCVGVLLLFIADRYVVKQIPVSLYQSFDKAVQTDYSVSVIDFMEKLPYTLSYEKTSIK